jgi:catalase
MANDKHNRLTTSAGMPVDDDLRSITAGEHGPTLVQDVHLIDKLAHFDRERIPERVVHAKGAGAYGYFEVTADMTQYTRAKFLDSVGKRTEVFLRFSTVGGERGSADADRDPRGFALKFYTEEGNYDMVGNNTPVFFLRDALKFPDFIHTQKRNPQTNLKDPDAFWDFLSLTPESMHQVTILFSDRGTPKSYRHMHGFSSHTFMWYNAEGQHVWIKLHFKSEQTSIGLPREEAAEIGKNDPDHATRDLFESIQRGKFPAWKVCAQIMTQEQAEAYHINIFDVTKVWPHGDFPLIPFGRLVLDRNPQNYHAEVEQATFSPGNFVPGIAASPDKMLQGRLFSYHDTHRHRVGANHHLLPVNASKHAPECSYQRDGAMRSDANGGPGPNYWPNSFGGPQPDASAAPPPLSVAGSAMRHEVELTDFDFFQPGELYRKVMTEQERSNLVGNIVAHLGNAQPFLQYRQSALFWKADADYGRRVAEGLGLDCARVKVLAAMSQGQRVAATQPGQLEAQSMAS